MNLAAWTKFNQLTLQDHYRCQNKKPELTQQEPEKNDDVTEYVLAGEEDVETFMLLLASFPNAVETNSVELMYHAFGIEATVEFLTREFEKVICEKTFVHNRHYNLLANVMCYSGIPKSIKKIDMQDKSPISRAAYQQSVNMFVHGAIYNQTDELNSVSAKIATGTRLDMDLIQVIEKKWKKKQEEEKDLPVFSSGLPSISFMVPDLDLT